MKMVNLILIFILSFGIAFSQQFNLFDVFPLGGLKVKYDRYGNPWAVGLSSRSGGNFYLFRSENGRFKSPVVIGKVQYVYSVQYVNWDFDIDTSGVVHIAGVIYEGFRDGYNNPAPFYLNSEMDSAVVFNAVSLGFNPPNPNHDYIRVLRTTDDKIVANVAIWFPYSSYTRYPDSLIWVQLVNPSANSIRATIDTIYLGDLKSKGGIIVWNLSINKNLFLMTYGWYRIGASSDGSIDTVAYTFAIYRIRPGGRAEMINSAEIVRVNIVGERIEPAPLPYYIADLNDGANAWLIRWFNVWSPFPRFDGGIVSAEEDREGNLHLVGINAKQYIYQVYTPANRPANEEGKVPTYSYVISYDSTIHWQFKTELIDWQHYIPDLSVSAFNLNKATITFSGWQLYQVGNKWRGVPGKVLLHQESGNYRYELLAGTSTDEINRLRFGLSTNWYIDNSGQAYLWNDWESIGFDSTRTAYIYLYKLRSTGNSFIMNYSLTNDIKEKMISPIPVGKIPGYAFSDFQYKFDKDKRMYFLVLTIDSLRPATYHLGRMFLVKETSPGQWDTTLVSTDTTNVLWFDYYTDFVVDENGNVHVVYATYKGGRSMVFYTNNEGGSFKTPIPVDTTRILRYARIRVSRNGLVYIWGQDLNINRYFYYYGDYVSGFKRSSRDFSDFDKAEVDANGNLYIVSSPWWSSSGYSVYLYKFNRDSALIYRFPNKILFTFQSGSPIVYPSFTFVRDENWQIHLLGVYESKLYYWKSSDNFTARVEYDLSNVLKFRSGIIISAVANDLDKRIYFFTTLSTFEPMIVGWIPYTVTGVEKDGNVLPREFSLSQNYPNPFNPATTISFELPVKSSVEISIYDVLGRKLKTVLEEVKDAGRYKVVVDMSGYASGVYFYRMVAKPVVGGSDFISVRKMLLIK